MDESLAFGTIRLVGFIYSISNLNDICRGFLDGRGESYDLVIPIWNVKAKERFFNSSSAFYFAVSKHPEQAGAENLIEY